MEKWYSINLEKKYVELFKKALKNDNIYYELSKCGNLYHFEIYMSELFVERINNMLDLVYFLVDGE